MFSLSNELFIFVNPDSSLVKVMPCCLNPNLALNVCTVVLLQSMVTLFATFLSIKIMLGCTFG